jgi:alkanesulfonate monooxygenase SsuD/methylene tetrahydromethanopterin reductase-like flavin-dependent oxidoreductase (luciferase family)
MNRINLAVDLDGTGWHPAAHLESGVGSAQMVSARHWLQIIAEAERGLLDFVTFGEPRRLRIMRDGEPPGARLDAVVLATRVAPATRHLGLIPAVTTSITEPFLVSSQVATLDHVTAGRSGLEVVVSLDERDGGYVGPRAVPSSNERYVEAAEYVEATRRLWDSWEDDAEIRDAESHRFVDRDRLHHIDFAGRHITVKGPSITPRPPQGQPVVATVATGPDSDAFAVASADVVFVAAATETELRQRIGGLTTAGERDDHGNLRVLAEVGVILDDDPGVAAEREARLENQISTASSWTGLRYTGTPAGLAEQLIDWTSLGCAGFRLRPASLSHDLIAITRRLTPQLRSLGVFRSDYEAGTLRGLLGLSRPTNRHAVA